MEKFQFSVEIYIPGSYSWGSGVSIYVAHCFYRELEVKEQSYIVHRQSGLLDLLLNGDMSI